MSLFILYEGTFVPSFTGRYQDPLAKILTRLKLSSSTSVYGLQENDSTEAVHVGARHKPLSISTKSLTELYQ
jgi:hypothetical protein